MNTIFRRTTPAHGAQTGGPDVDDDEPVGKVLSRRQVLRLLGGGSAAAALAACVPAAMQMPAPTPTQGATTVAANTVLTPTTGVETIAACVVRPAMTEGPYFVDEMLNRADIRIDTADNSVSEGALLQLSFRVQQMQGNGCAPLSGVQVDIWHCDAYGVYSDVTDRGFQTLGHTFLRGYQVTDANGIATFTTIYPGWYSGRAVHIHYKVRTDPASQQGYEFTSQLFFDDLFTDQVYANPPYAARGERNVRNADEGIFRNGDQTVLEVTTTPEGYATLFDIALEL